MWRYGAPSRLCSASRWSRLALWRGGVRFGPLTAASETARRSLAEQIRGTGQFVLRHGGGEALHAAAVRALNEAAHGAVAELCATVAPTSASPRSPRPPASTAARSRPPSNKPACAAPHELRSSDRPHRNRARRHSDQLAGPLMEHN